MQSSVVMLQTTPFSYLNLGLLTRFLLFTLCVVVGLGAWP